MSLSGRERAEGFRSHRYCGSSIWSNFDYERERAEGFRPCVACGKFLVHIDLHPND